jgi:spermidine/putrescine transport system ATP-binding protein
VSTADGKPVIEADRVSKSFGSFLAVDDVSLDIRAGEFFSMLGPSGCGKTTMLRLIAGFEDVTTGKLRLNGADVMGVPPYRRPVNTVFQNYALFPHLSVFDNVAFGPRIRSEDGGKVERRVRAMLDVVRLGDFASRMPSQLSGGQRQRVALARALVNDPAALLLDEPLSALDLELRRQMQLELKRIQRELGITFVFVTHDQEEALTMSDRIAVMRGGRLEQVGSPEEIYDAPTTAFVARFIGSANLISVRVERAGGGRAAVRLPGGVTTELAIDGLAFEPGSTVLLMVRPERLEVRTTAPEPGRAALRATCTDLVFQGAVLRCAMRDDEGGELVAYLEASRGIPGVYPGAIVSVSWEPDAARLLHPDGTSAAEQAGAAPP